MTDPELEPLQGCTCSVMGLSIPTLSDVLQHVLMHSYRCSKVYVLQHRHPLGPQSLQRYTFCGTDIAMGTDALRGTWYGRGLSIARLFDMSCSHVDLAIGHSPFGSSSYWSFSLSSSAAQKQQRCLDGLPVHGHCWDEHFPGHHTVRS